MKINSNTTTPTIANIYTDILEAKIILQPSFQRKFVWSASHQEEFIDSILKGYPFPEIYVCNGETNTTTFKSSVLVIDGQQRLTTIKNYIEGQTDTFFKKIPPYKSLQEAEKKEFASYTVVVRNIGDVEEDVVREVFRRINLTKFSLDTIEIHNAIYDGEYIQCAKEILASIDMKSYGVLKSSEFNRMADLHFILLLMSTLENGSYFAQDREMEEYISRYNDSYPNAAAMKATLKSAFDTVTDLGLPKDSMWFRKSNFFTLITEVSTAINEGNLPAPADLELKLNEFNDNLYNKKDSDEPYKEYYNYMYQGTHNRTARVRRGEIFKEYCLK
ncbi:DUF262 domain-containing protein (plasmid) [Cronobacter dublinensis subsp. infanticibi]|uniref:DUF262 domain-containing protein n=1 Tax=Cronobacter dublinensis TaxID=413497 RepID=UPI0023DD4ABA|nr:DUF262 domain-containing protein [Cronobacter dublinensis]WEP47715.1 DUF262 domain-containing protein [Cronobacter dublinensis]